MIRTSALAAAAVLALGGLTHADEEKASLSDVGSLREHLMENNAAAAGIGGKMLKGEAPFDAGAAQAVFLTLNNTALGFGVLFPEGSQEADMGARDTVWSDRKGFEAAVQKFIDNTSAAVAAKVSTPEAFKEQFIAVTANCISCHETYKKPD